MKYSMIEEKLPFSDRLELVHQNVLTRLYNRNFREFTKTSPAPMEGKNPFADVFEEMEEAPYVICLANAIVHSWLTTPVMIFPNEAIVGITRPEYPLLEHFSWGITYNGTEKKQENGYSAEETARIERLRPRWEPSNLEYMHRYGREQLGAEKYEALCRENMFWAGSYQGHTIPNYTTLLSHGLDEMLNVIDFWAEKNKTNQDAVDFYEANRIIVRGMSSFLQQYANRANELYLKETNPTQKQYYLEIAENCAYVAHKKPVTLYQAVQLAWILSLWDWVDCLGRVDQFFLPYYQYSCKYGDVISVEDSIASLMFKIWENGAHNVTVSGCNPIDGSDATNDLSFLFLQVLRNIHDTHPRMAVRIREDIDSRLLALIIKIWSEGMSDPAIISDKAVIPALQRIGIPIQDARDYATLGCQEIEVPGKSNTGCEDGGFNVAKALEVALRGGKATHTPNYQLGPKTKSLLECDSFEDVFASFSTQLAYFTQIHTALCSKGQQVRSFNHSKLVKGVFTDGVLESGRNHDDGGPIYGHGVIETAGVAAAADSLTAIKKLVFEEGKISKQVLFDALENDFNGYEKERLMLLNDAPKFGNDDEDADQMMVRVLNQYWDEIAKYKSIRGGVYTGACSLLTAGISLGASTGALPDGRHSGEPLGNSMGPRPGADHSGVTAMLSSVAKLPLHKGVGGTTLNVILTTKMLSTPEFRSDIGALIKTFMNSGGQMAQITTANLEDLVDAKLHPERHGDLIVRVGGYSTQFVLCDTKTQDEIISRYAGGI